MPKLEASCCCSGNSMGGVTPTSSGGLLTAQGLRILVSVQKVWDDGERAYEFTQTVPYRCLEL